MPYNSVIRHQPAVLLATITLCVLFLVVSPAVLSQQEKHSTGNASETLDDYATVSADVLSRRWPNGIVYYTVERSPKAQHDESDLNELNQWEVLTQGAVRFIRRTTEADFIKIVITDGRTQTNGLRGRREADGTLFAGERVIYIHPINSLYVNHQLLIVNVWSNLHSGAMTP